MKWYSSSMLVRGAAIADAIGATAEAGFDGIEIWVDQAHEHGEDPRELARVAQHHGIGTSVHASSYDLNLAAWNRGIRAESQRQTIASLEFAAALGTPVCVVHPGRRSSSRDEIADYWPLVLESLEPVDAAAADLGITIGLELMEDRPKEVVMLPDDARRVMTYGYRSMGITVDLAHSWSHYDPVQFLKDMDIDWIVHVHLSDSDPRTIHLPLGEGEVDLAHVYKGLLEVGYDRIVNIEGYAQGRGNDLLESNRRAINEVVEIVAAQPIGG